MYRIVSVSISVCAYACRCGGNWMFHGWSLLTVIISFLFFLIKSYDTVTLAKVDIFLEQCCYTNIIITYYVSVFRQLKYWGYTYIVQVVRIEYYKRKI